MKKITLILATATVVILFFFTGCEKLHRNSYTGKWDFVVIHRWGAYYESNYDTIYYSGKINIGGTYNTLVVEYMKKTKIKMEVDECGQLFKEYEDPHEIAVGKFFGNDSVEIELGYRALGGGDLYFITGNKINRRR